MLTPRYLKEFTCSRTLPFNHKVIESERLHLFLLMSITLHLLGLSVRWLSTDHFSISEMSSWSSDKSCLQDIGLYNIRSSAYRASILWCHGFLLVVWLTKSFCLNGHFNKTLQTTQQPKTLKGAAQQTFMYGHQVDSVSKWWERVILLVWHAFLFRFLSLRSHFRLPVFFFQAIKMYKHCSVGLLPWPTHDKVNVVIHVYKHVHLFILEG